MSKSSLGRWRGRVAAGVLACLSWGQALSTQPVECLAASFDSTATGSWSDSSNWAPVGVPGPGDTALLKDNSPAAGGPALTLAGDTTVANLHVGDTSIPGSSGRLDLNGFVLTTTNSLTVGRFGGVGFLDGRSSGGTAKFLTPELSVNSAGNLFILFDGDRAARVNVGSGATVETSSVDNVTVGVFISSQGSLLDLGDDLVLSEDLDIRGTAAMPATVDANGHDITARDVFVGRFGASGEILNRGTITAMRNLEASNSIFTLNPSDSVAVQVAATNNGVLTLDPATAAQRAATVSGGRVNLVATGNVTVGAEIFGQGSLFDLGDDLVLSQDLDIRGSGANVATVDAHGNNITARDVLVGRFGSAGEILNRGTITATRNLEASNSIFTLNPGDSVAVQVAATNNGVLTLDPSTAAQRAATASGGRVNLVATGNVTVGAEIFGQGSLFDLGDDLVLTEDLDIRGSGANVATVDAHGNNITARDVYVGRFGSAGEIINAGAITVDRFAADASHYEFEGGDDQVEVQLKLANGATARVQQQPGETGGLTLNGSALDILDTSVLTIDFDASTTGDYLDYGFRWANAPGEDRVDEIVALINGGQIEVNSPGIVRVFSYNDGYTYVTADHYPADFDEDADVDATDLASWQAGFGISSGAAHADGDADQNHQVNGRDFLIWQIQYGLSANAISPVQAVPEPTSLSLLLAVASLAAAIRGLRRSRHNALASS
ncbi:MAG: hypothetical protein KDA44_15545 [Planctomycetales bacterium]|nr:hypothetical protein [Planctomycetales bacterium]